MKTCFKGSRESPSELCDGSISEVLDSLGVNSAHNGYYYIAYAVELAISDPGILDNMTEKVYPEIERKFGLGKNTSERCIRSAIERAFSSGGSERLREVFRFETKESSGKVTNSAFIRRMLELLGVKPGFYIEDKLDCPPEVSYAIADYLKKMHISDGFKGFRYLAYAISILLSSPDADLSESSIYPKIEEHFHVSANSSFRCIKYAIRSALECDSGEREKMLKIFGSKNGRIRNSEFLRKSVEILSKELNMPCGR